MFWSAQCTCFSSLLHSHSIWQRSVGWRLFVKDAGGNSLQAPFLEWGLIKLATSAAFPRGFWTVRHSAAGAASATARLFQGSAPRTCCPCRAVLQAPPCNPQAVGETAQETNLITASNPLWDGCASSHFTHSLRFFERCVQSEMKKVAFRCWMACLQSDSSSFLHCSATLVSIRIKNDVF